MADASDEGSITHCLGLLRQGDPQACAGDLGPLLPTPHRLARARLHSIHLRAADEEDVVLNAFDSFFRRARRGQFPRLEDRDDLWQLLFVLTVRKAINLARHERRGSRGSGQVGVLSDLEGLDIEAVIGDVPTPELARKWLTSAAGFSGCWATQLYARSRCGKWRGTPTPRSLGGLVASRTPSGGSSGRSAKSGRRIKIGMAALPGRLDPTETGCRALMLPVGQTLNGNSAVAMP